MSRTPVLAIWLDSLDADLALAMARSGEMPHLAGLLRGGASGDLESLPFGSAEAGYGMVITGCEPGVTGHWAMRAFDPDTYGLAPGNPCDLRRNPAFFAADPALETILFDLPKTPIIESLRGIQICNWGSHSAGVPRASSPPAWMDDLLSRRGEHPAGCGNDHANLDAPGSLIDLHARLLEGLRLRAEVAGDLMRARHWNLFFMGVGEPHNAGHYFWPHPGCPAVAATTGGWRMVRDIYRETDLTLGRIMAAAGEDVTVVVFSVQGIRPNHEDLASLVFLPELLARESFPGMTCLDFSSPVEPYPNQDWASALFRFARPPQRVSGLLRRRLAPAAVVEFERARGLPPALFHPSVASTLGYQPLVWYQPYWPAMKAFALPTNSQGSIRLNVRGRERDGSVAPEDYRRVCDDVIAALQDLTDPVSGRPAVTEVIRTRPDFAIGQEGKHLPEADLVVRWDPDLGNQVVSGRHGRLGPVPFHRAGTHTRRGFLCISGPGIPAGSRLPAGRPVDIGPTILALCGVTPPASLSGHPLCRRIEASAGGFSGIPVDITAPPPRLGLVMCIRNEERFLAENLLYHRALGVDIAFVYLDACEDRSLEIAQSLEWVRLFRLQLDPRPDYVADLNALCMNHALRLARGEGLDWLLTLDPDEFAFGEAWGERGRPGATLSWRGNLPRMLSRIPGDVDMVRLPTKELVPTARPEGCRFWEHGWFQDERAPLERDILHPLTGERVRWNGFLGHREGKSIIRVKAGIQAYDSHRWVLDQGRHYPDRPDPVPPTTLEAGFHLHFLITNAAHWQEKYRKFSHVPSTWPCGTPVEFPKQCWKEAAVALSESGARDYYRKWVGVSAARLATAERNGAILRCDHPWAVLSENGLLNPEGSPVLPHPPRGGETPSPVLSLADLTDSGSRPESDYRLEPGRLSPRLLKGFYPVEQASGKLFRWARPDASIRLNVPAADYRVDLHADPLCDLFPGLEGASLCGKPVPVERIETTPTGVGFFLPASAFAGADEPWLEFHFRAVDTSGWPGETRQLGAPVFRCDLLPAE